MGTLEHAGSLTGLASASTCAEAVPHAAATAASTVETHGLQQPPELQRPVAAPPLAQQLPVRGEPQPQGHPQPSGPQAPHTAQGCGSSELTEHDPHHTAPATRCAHQLGPLQASSTENLGPPASLDLCGEGGSDLDGMEQASDNGLHTSMTHDGACAVGRHGECAGPPLPRPAACQQGQAHDSTGLLLENGNDSVTGGDAAWTGVQQPAARAMPTHTVGQPATCVSQTAPSSPAQNSPGTHSAWAAASADSAYFMTPSPFLAAHSSSAAQGGNGHGWGSSLDAGSPTAASSATLAHSSMLLPRGRRARKSIDVYSSFGRVHELLAAMLDTRSEPRASGTMAWAGRGHDGERSSTQGDTANGLFFGPDKQQGLTGAFGSTLGDMSQISNWRGSIADGLVGTLQEVSPLPMLRGGSEPASQPQLGLVTARGRLGLPLSGSPSCSRSALATCNTEEAATVYGVGAGCNGSVAGEGLVQCAAGAGGQAAVAGAAAIGTLKENAAPEAAAGGQAAAAEAQAEGVGAAQGEGGPVVLEVSVTQGVHPGTKE